MTTTTECGSRDARLANRARTGLRGEGGTGEDASRGVPRLTFGFVRVSVRCALPARADEPDACTAFVRPGPFPKAQGDDLESNWANESVSSKRSDPHG